jgi:hypothetical protein
MLIATPQPLEAATIAALARSEDWKLFVDYLQRALREIDLQLRGCSPDRLGKLQGVASTVDDIIRLPDTAREILKNRT